MATVVMALVVCHVRTGILIGRKAFYIFSVGHTFPDFSFSRFEEIGKTGNDYEITRNFTAMFLIELLP